MVPAGGAREGAHPARGHVLCVFLCCVSAGLMRSKFVEYMPVVLVRYVLWVEASCVSMRELVCPLVMFSVDVS